MAGLQGLFKLGSQCAEHRDVSASRVQMCTLFLNKRILRKIFSAIFLHTSILLMLIYCGRKSVAKTITAQKPRCVQSEIISSVLR